MSYIAPICGLRLLPTTTEKLKAILSLYVRPLPFARLFCHSLQLLLLGQPIAMLAHENGQIQYPFRLISALLLPLFPPFSLWIVKTLDNWHQISNYLF